jgi:2-keto-myo-inositol isomerase
MGTDRHISRRQFLSASASGVVAAGLTPLAAVQGESKESGRSPAPFRYCLNMGTIMGQRLSLEQEIEIAAKAGYDAIEPWLRTINNFQTGGGSLKDLRKRLADAGLTVESSMSFPSWAVDDEDRRARALEQLKSEMEMVAQIGGKRIAAPPAGVNMESGLDLMKAAERYRAILEIGDQTGVTPALEIWGPSRNLSQLGEAAFVAAQCGHPKACLLLDVYHIYKGGSDFHGLKVLSNRAMPVFHMNDYPAEPPRESIQDRDRVFPGDGVAPLSQILRDLHDNGGGTVLSLELFSPTYWKQDALTVAKTGLEKMKAAVAKALG